MAKIFGKRIPYLVPKDTAGGKAFFWQPSAKLRANGWEAEPLGTDMVAAIKAAEALNAKVDEWRHGGAKPKAVKTFIDRTTVGGLIMAYRRDEKFTELAKTTQTTYTSALNLIEMWATSKPASDKSRKLGDIAAASITTERVKVLRNALMKPNAEGIVQHHRAHGTLRVARTLWAFGVKEKLVDKNPFEDFDLSTPAPRHQIWEYDDVVAFSAAAARIGYPGLAFAVELAEYIGQREGDILKLQASQYREVRNLDERDHAAILAEDRKAGISDGRAMGIHIRQGKTRVWVGIPVAGQMRKQIEAAIATNAKRTVPTMSIVVDDATGRAWTVRQFIRKFVEAKERAVAPTDKDIEAGVIAHPELAGLQFRDLRRTCVVRLGELGLEDQLISAITGHKLEGVKKILEVYMPRTTKMAARAVVARIGHNPGAAEAREKHA